MGSHPMIDLESENVFTLTEAVKHLPRRNSGRRQHPSTVVRWAKKGLRGVQLETIRVGGTLCTSLEALQRFCNALSGGQTHQPTTQQASTAAKRADEALTALGI
jgi:hypothetical protein